METLLRSKVKGKSRGALKEVGRNQKIKIMERIGITVSFSYFNRPEMYKGAALFVEEEPRIFVPFNRHELKNIIAILYEVAEERGIKVERDSKGHVAYLAGSHLTINDVASLFEEVKRRYTPKPRYMVAAVEKKGSYYLAIVESGHRLIKCADGPSLSQEQFFALPLGKKFRVSRKAVGHLLPGAYFSYKEALKAQEQICNEMKSRKIEVGYQVVAIEKDNGYTFLKIMKRIAGTLVKTSRSSVSIPYELFQYLPRGEAYSLENLATGYPLPGVYSTIEEAEEAFNKIIKSCQE